MFASLGYDEELTAQKAALAARCEVERRAAGAYFAEIESRTGWVDLVWAAAKLAAPSARFALPIAGALAAKWLLRGRRRAVPVVAALPSVGGKLALVWRVARWVLPLVRQWLAARRRA